MRDIQTLISSISSMLVDFCVVMHWFSTHCCSKKCYPNTWLKRCCFTSAGSNSCEKEGAHLGRNSFKTATRRRGHTPQHRKRATFEKPHWKYIWHLAVSVNMIFTASSDIPEFTVYIHTDCKYLVNYHLMTNTSQNNLPWFLSIEHSHFQGLESSHLCSWLHVMWQFTVTIGSHELQQNPHIN